MRSASLKFADTRFESPLDLLMNTGTVPLFWSARTFAGFMARSTAGSGKFYVSYLNSHPQAAFDGGDSVRRDPDSFANMVYHTKTVSGFIGEDGVLRYARYRLIPDPWDGSESGLPNDWDRDHAWLQNPDADERRHRNYLKDATRRLLDSGGKLRYRNPTSPPAP